MVMLVIKKLLHIIFDIQLFYKFDDVITILNFL